MSDQPAISDTSASGQNQAHAEEIARLQAAIHINNLMLDTLPMLILLYEVEGNGGFRMRFQNLAARMFGGFGGVDHTGTLLTDVLSPEDAERASQWFQKCIDAGEPIDAEAAYEFPSGTMWTYTTYIPMRDEDGRITHILLVTHDITEAKARELAEQQRRDEIIAQQSAALVDLSTPLLTISDTTLVMPLVGAIDSQRIQQIMDNLLHGVAERRAQAVILDITGVSVVDTQVASALVQAAQAVSLLGCHVILTGIRPEVAQILVSLGVELRGITTRATLQDGIAYALRRG